MRILLTGATGTAGSGALRAAIADPAIDGITVLSRRPPREEAENVHFIAHTDFTNFSTVRKELASADAVIWSLGTSQNRVGRDELHHITVDYAVAGAQAFRASNPKGAFLHLSGSGADPTGKSRMPFAIEKGRAENALNAMGFDKLWHFRPGYIHPPRMVEKPLLQDRVIYPLAPLLRPFKAAMVDADDLGRAMLNVAKNGHSGRVIDNQEIRRLASRVPT